MPRAAERRNSHGIHQEKEKEYYNKKLIKETVKDEAKKPYKFDWKDFLLQCLGTSIGFILIDIIGIDELINNGVLGFITDVMILVLSITAVNIAASVIKKLIARK